MMDWLKLLGFDRKKPLKALFSLLNLLFLDRVHEEIYNYLSHQIPRKRRVDLAVKLRVAAIDLESDDLVKASQTLAEILRSIKL